MKFPNFPRPWPNMPFHPNFPRQEKGTSVVATFFFPKTAIVPMSTFMKELRRNLYNPPSREKPPQTSRKQANKHLHVTSLRSAVPSRTLCSWASCSVRVLRMSGALAPWTYATRTPAWKWTGQDHYDPCTRPPALCNLSQKGRTTSPVLS